MWLSLSFLVLALTVVQDVLHRWMMWFGFGSYELVLYGLIPTVLFGIAYVAINRIPLKKPQPKHMLLFIASGILSFFMFHWLRSAQIKSPNIGYVNIIIYSSALFTIFATSLLFKDSLDPHAIVGAVLILVGLGLLTTVNHVRT